MATFVIESYLSAARAGELEATTAKLRATVERATSQERPMRHLRSYSVPGDELAFHLVEARSIEEVFDVSRAAGIVAERIVEAEAIPD